MPSGFLARQTWRRVKSCLPRRATYGNHALSLGVGEGRALQVRSSGAGEHGGRACRARTGASPVAPGAWRRPAGPPCARIAGAGFHGLVDETRMRRLAPLGWVSPLPSSASWPTARSQAAASSRLRGGVLEAARDARVPPRGPERVTDGEGALCGDGQSVAVDGCGIMTPKARRPDEGRPPALDLFLRVVATAVGRHGWWRCSVSGSRF